MICTIIFLTARFQSNLDWLVSPLLSFILANVYGLFYVASYVPLTVLTTVICIM